MLRTHIEAVILSFKGRYSSNLSFLLMRRNQVLCHQDSDFTSSTPVANINLRKILLPHKISMILFEHINTFAFLIQVKRKAKKNHGDLHICNNTCLPQPRGHPKADPGVRPMPRAHTSSSGWQHPDGASKEPNTHRWVTGPSLDCPQGHTALGADAQAGCVCTVDTPGVREAP